MYFNNKPQSTAPDKTEKLLKKALIIILLTYGAVSLLEKTTNDLIQLFSSPQKGSKNYPISPNNIDTVSGEIAHDMCTSLQGDIKNDLLKIDSLSYDAYFHESIFLKNTTHEALSGYNGSTLIKGDHAYNKFIAPSIPYVSDYMQQHNIHTISDIIAFSDTITYEDSVQKKETYNGCQIRKTPYQTLHDMKGDCDDMSLLYYTMCTILGEDAILVSFPHHMNLLVPAQAFGVAGGKIIVQHCPFTAIQKKSAHYNPICSIRHSYSIGDTTFVCTHIQVEDKNYTMLEVTHGSKGVIAKYQPNISDILWLHKNTPLPQE